MGVDGISSNLLSILLMSEKRKNVALLLKEGPKSSNDIKDILGLSSSSVMPQIKILKDNHIIEHKDHTYSLSPIGHLLVHHMIPLLGMSAMLEQNLDYWSEHDISKLPSDFKLRLCELGECTVLNPPNEAPHEMPSVLVEHIKNSNFVCIVSSYFYTGFMEINQKLNEQGTNVVRISTKAVLDKWIERYQENDEKSQVFDNIKFYVTEDELHIPAMLISDKVLSLSLYDRNGVFDNRRITSQSEGALKWGIDYFNYYLEKSKPVNISELLK
jgi:predicted transcriptional regulator